MQIISGTPYLRTTGILAQYGINFSCALQTFGGEGGGGGGYKNKEDIARLPSSSCAHDQIMFAPSIDQSKCLATTGSAPNLRAKFLCFSCDSSPAAERLSDFAANYFGKII